MRCRHASCPGIVVRRTASLRSPMPGHPRLGGESLSKTWMAGTSPAMTIASSHRLAVEQHGPARPGGGRMRSRDGGEGGDERRGRDGGRTWYGAFLPDLTRHDWPRRLAGGTLPKPRRHCERKRSNLASLAHAFVTCACVRGGDCFVASLLAMTAISCPVPPSDAPSPSGRARAPSSGRTPRGWSSSPPRRPWSAARARSARR
jgi:hypothetical protein